MQQPDMIIRRWNDLIHGGRVKVYPRTWSKDRFFFFSVLLRLAMEAFGGGKNCNRPSFYLSPPSLFLFLEGLLCYIFPPHWSWPSICWSCRLPLECLSLECLSHLLSSSTCCELQQTRWYCSGAISSLMRPDCQLRAFNAEVTASPRIAPSPRPHSWPTVLVLLFGTPRRTVFEGMPLSPSVALVCRGQDCPRRCLPVAWTFLVHPRMFLLPRRGPWAWYEVGRGCQILRPHNCNYRIEIKNWIIKYI